MISQLSRAGILGLKVKVLAAWAHRRLWGGCFQAHPGCWKNQVVILRFRSLCPCWLSAGGTLRSLGPSGGGPVCQGRPLRVRHLPGSGSDSTPALSSELQFCDQERKFSAFGAQMHNAGSLPISRFRTLTTHINKVPSAMYVTHRIHRFQGLGHGHPEAALFCLQHHH